MKKLQRQSSNRNDRPFYIPDATKVGAGLRDSHGTAYEVIKGGAIKRVGPKVRK